MGGNLGSGGRKIKHKIKIKKKSKSKRKRKIKTMRRHGRHGRGTQRGVPTSDVFVEARPEGRRVFFVPFIPEGGEVAEAVGV